MTIIINQPIERFVPNIRTIGGIFSRRSIREKNRKFCDDDGGGAGGIYGFGGFGGGASGGICRSERSSAAAKGRPDGNLGVFWKSLVCPKSNKLNTILQWQ